MLLLQKIKDIDQKISELKQQQERLQQQIELKIINLLKTEKAFNIDFAILYGAMYELSQQLKNGGSSDHLFASQMKNWQQIGLSLLQKKETGVKIRSSKQKTRIKTSDAKVNLEKQTS